MIHNLHNFWGTGNTRAKQKIRTIIYSLDGRSITYSIHNFAADHISSEAGLINKCTSTTMYWHETKSEQLKQLKMPSEQNWRLETKNHIDRFIDQSINLVVLYMNRITWPYNWWLKSDTCCATTSLICSDSVSNFTPFVSRLQKSTFLWTSIETTKNSGRKVNNKSTLFFNKILSTS